MDFMKMVVLLVVFSFPQIAMTAEPVCAKEGEVVVTSASGVVTSCCAGLEPNAAKVCDEPAFVDPKLVSCSAHSSCRDGTGCYPQSYKDLFSSASPSGPGDEAEIIKDQVGTGGNGYPGSGCSHARECSSYSCVQGKCENKLVCRFAKIGEPAPSSVKCSGTNKVNANGVCATPPDEVNPVFPGLNDKISFKEIGKCQFEAEDEVKRKTVVAMKSLRAMEWFLATISLRTDVEECFNIVPTLKDKIGVPLYEDRKSILAGFSSKLNGIENDFKTLIAAKPGNLREVKIHIDEDISEADLSSRKTSGYDSLMLMLRSNILFQSYERYMIESIHKNGGQLSSFSQMIGTWQNNSQINPNCDGSFYMQWKSFSTHKQKFYNDVQDHWAIKYFVSGVSEYDKKVVFNPGVANALALIANKSPNEAVADFTSRPHFLLDPLFFGKMKTGQYGLANKSMNDTKMFLGLWGKIDFRKTYTLVPGAYAKMYSFLKLSLREHYKGLKRGEAEGFIYEPELVTTEAKDCLDNPAKNEKCAEFEKYLDDILNEGFAYFLAYSHSRNPTYENFFTNATTYRRKLFNKLEVDLQHLSKYYTAVSAQRELQNACIESVIDGLKKSGILVKDSGKGLTEGASVKLPSTKGTNSNLNSNISSIGNTLTTTPNARNKFSFALKTSSLISGGGASKINDSSSSSTSFKNSSQVRTSMGDAVSTNVAFAARRKSMIEANNKAISAGVNMADKEKSVQDAMSNLANSSGASINGLTNSASRASRSGLGLSALDSGSVVSPTSNQSSSPSPATADPAAKSELRSSPTPDGISGNTESFGFNEDVSVISEGEDASDPSTYSRGVHAGSGIKATPRGVNSGGPTPLTDSQKQTMLSAADQNSSDYQGSDEDGIFTKVSKAYVRNLDKVFEKKKKID